MGQGGVCVCVRPKPNGRDTVAPLPFGIHPYARPEAFGELRMRCGLFESLLKASA